MSKELSEFLEKELRRRRLSQRGGALYADIGTTTLHYIINNPESNPRPDTLQAIADGWNVSIRQLFELAGYFNPRQPSSSAAPATEPEWRVLEIFRDLPEGQQDFAIAILELIEEHKDGF